MENKLKSEIIESNQLIAKFMNLKQMSCIESESEEYYWIDENGSQYNLFYKNSGLSWPFLSAPPFCSDWRWLMPVVEFISHIRVDWENATPTDTYYPRTFGMLNAETGNPMVRLNANSVFEAKTLIEATWLAVVDFIKWHSSLTPPKHALKMAEMSLGDEIEKKSEHISIIPPAPASKETLAVECIRDLGQAYKLSFKISYNQKQNRWGVNVMGTYFNDYDFCRAVGLAIQFVLKAKGVVLGNTKSE